MLVSTTFNPVNDIVLLVVFISGVVVTSHSKIPRQNVIDLQALNSTQDTRIKALEEERLADAKIIGTLEGQVQTYKELPLRELADGIKEVVDISKENARSNQAILDQLKRTAVIAAQDRDVLTNQNLHIKTEVHKVMDENG